MYPLGPPPLSHPTAIYTSLTYTQTQAQSTNSNANCTHPLRPHLSPRLRNATASSPPPSANVCQDHTSALALVSAYKTIQYTSDPSASTRTRSIYPTASSSSTPDPRSQKSESERTEENPDLQRALDLMDLHYGVKIRHMEHGEAELEKAREGVRKVIENLREQEKDE